MRLAVALMLSILVAGCGVDGAGAIGLPTSSRVPSDPPSSAASSPTTAPTPTRAAAPTTRPTTATAPTPRATAKPTPKPVPSPTAAPPRPTLAQLVGQKLVVRLSGTTPSPALLGRIGRGEIGGVILFGWNVTTKVALTSLTATLQKAASEGGQPPLLVATDQEGGTVKRIPWAPPTLSVPDMGEIGLASTAMDQGTQTGAALLGLGINCDLAPVADVPVTDDSFMYVDGRTWSFSASLTATLSNAFARGLETAGVVPVMKHFPGLGLALENTDDTVVELAATKAALAPGLEPYGAAIGRHIPMIMLSNATYAAYDAGNAAGWSRAISQTLLRDKLGFTGVSITDSLSGNAAARGLPSADLAIRAALAGTDMILVTGSEATTSAVFDALLAAARDGTILRSTLTASYTRILALKQDL